jgi:hypothetical protein
MIITMSRDLSSPLLLLLLVLLVAPLAARADMNDADQADSESDTSGTSDIDNMKDMNDPGILNPQRGQGYGNLDTNPPWRFTTTTPPPRTKVTTTPKPTFTQQSVTAVLEFGIIVSAHYILSFLVPEYFHLKETVQRDFRLGFFLNQKAPTKRRLLTFFLLLTV